MRIWRIYDDRNLRRELAGVVETLVSDTGALVCRMVEPKAPGNNLLCLVFAPGTWTDVEEWESDHHLITPVAATTTTTTTTTTDVEQTDPGADDAAPETAPVPDTDAMTDRERVHKAMLILCACDALRCPMVLNAASEGERIFWYRQLTGQNTGQPPEPEPMRRCIRNTGHEIDATGHYWAENGWPWGPGNHHPACPRHPESYNRGPLTIVGEGQPHTAVVTPAADPRGELVRPYVGDEPEFGFAPGRVPTLTAVEDQGFGFSREAEPDVPGTNPNDPYSSQLRTAWNVCAAYGPDIDGSDPMRAHTCDLEIGHPEPYHKVSLPGGDVVRW